MAKKKYIAKQPFVHGVNKTHTSIEVDQVFECDEDYAAQHLLPAGLVAEYKKKVVSDEVVALPTAAEVPVTEEVTQETPAEKSDKAVKGKGK